MDTTVDLSLFLTLGGGAALISALTEVVKRTANWSDELVARFASITAIVIGAILFVVITLATTAGVNVQGIAQALLAGVVAGLTSNGLYNVGGKAVITAVAGPTKP